MRRSLALLLAPLLALCAGLAAALAGAVPATAATQVWTYSGHSGATQVTALGTMIRSDLTAASNLTGNGIPDERSATVAGVNVSGLVKVGAASSLQQASAHGDGVQIRSTAKVAGVSLLNGLVKVDALETVATARAGSAGVDGSTSSTFLRLSINGKAYPVSLPANTKVTIPGIAEIVLNETKVDRAAAGKTVQAQVTALRLTLLKARSGAPAGAEIKLLPARALVVPTGPSDALPVGGFAYGTFAGVGVGDQAKVLAQPTGMLNLPSIGTAGKPYGNSVAATEIGKLLTFGAVETSVQAETVPGYADVDNSAQVARLNLLNGLVTLDGIKVRAHVRETTSGADVAESSTEFVNLKVAGRKIPVDVAPNTTINVAGVARVIVNQQVTQAGYAMVVGVRVTLSTARLGIPAGTDIHLAVASSYVVG